MPRCHAPAEADCQKKGGSSRIFATLRRERDKKMKSSIRIHTPGNQIRRRVSINHSVTIQIKPSYWVKKKEIDLKAHLNIHKAAAIDL
jgi:hypothetical protein